MSAVAIGLFVLACGWHVYRLFLPTKAAALRTAGHPQYFGAILAAAYVGLLAIFLHAASLKTDWYPLVLEGLVEIAPSLEDKKNSASALNVGTINVQSGAPVVTEALPLDTSRIVVGSEVTKDKQSSKQSGSYPILVGLGLWSGALMLLLPLVLNAPFLVNERLRHLAGRRSAGEVEVALIKALEREISVAVTLTTGKVYVGVPHRFDPTTPAEPDWIRVWPLASGYRSEEGKLTLTTTYPPAYERLSNGRHALSEDDFEITLPVGHIISIQSFSLRFYVEHFAGVAQSQKPSGAQSNGGAAEAQNVTVERLNHTLAQNSSSAIGGAVSDGVLQCLRWLFHLLFTASIIVAPWSLLLAFACLVIAATILMIVTDPADVHIAMFIESMKDA